MRNVTPSPGSGSGSQPFGGSSSSSSSLLTTPKKSAGTCRLRLRLTEREWRREGVGAPLEEASATVPLVSIRGASPDEAGGDWFVMLAKGIRRSGASAQLMTRELGEEASSGGADAFLTAA